MDKEMKQLLDELNKLFPVTFQEGKSYPLDPNPSDELTITLNGHKYIIYGKDLCVDVIPV